MSGTPVRRSTPLAVQVADHFRRLIELGEWPVGARIPGEHELAAQLQVSRGTVREALRALRSADLLEARVGDGTYVRRTDELSAVLARGRGESLDHVLAVRAALEQAAAAGAPVNRTATQLRALRTALRRRDKASLAGDVEGYTVADTAYHRALVQAAGNPLLTRIYTALDEVMAGSIRATAQLPEHPDVARLHHEMFEAVRDRDPAAAVAACGALHAVISGPGTGCAVVA